MTVSVIKMRLGEELFHIVKPVGSETMGYQPRMRGRGRRFGRRTMRKTSSREREEQQNASVFYQEPEQVNPSEVSLKVTNALKHLGDQRFPLPPYGEHFQRWLKDVKGILTEFETRLVDAADQEYRDNAQKALATVQGGLNKRIEEEKISGDSSLSLRRRLTTIEIELSRLENEYNKQSREIRRRQERVSQELQQEIDELGRQRLMLLSRRPNLLGRILKRSGSVVDEKTSSLQSKRNELGDAKSRFNKELKESRADHELKRKRLLNEQEVLRTKLAEQREDTQDDALEIRRRTCEELQQAINDAVSRSMNKST